MTGRLAPAIGISTTFTAGIVGTGTIAANAGGGITDTTGVITATPGAVNYIVIEDAADRVGSEVLTRTLVAGENLAVWAAGYDVANNYVGDMPVTWSGTGVVAGRLAPTSGFSTTFTTETDGMGTIEANAGGGITDATGIITVSYWKTYLPVVIRGG
jgi:hypothetical protein